ncbi:hypothetical protein D5086_002149 [Populus alba]|uniref:Uncharacterized protein n=1 Tax=Populus alba TaxID=43335 RepID=A0ACC4D177_POPAL
MESCGPPLLLAVLTGASVGSLLGCINERTERVKAPIICIKIGKSKCLQTEFLTQTEEKLLACFNSLDLDIGGETLLRSYKQQPRQEKMDGSQPAHPGLEMLHAATER